jgi:outer membrane protein TolC
MRRRLVSGVVSCAPAFALLFGCALQEYSPAPIDPAVSATQFEERSTNAPALRDYMARQGQPPAEWPLRRWNLSDLTLAAFYFQPELSVARAQAAVARAEVDAAVQRPPFGLIPRVSHHSRVRDDDSGPWSLGLALELPIVPASRREALRERYDALADAAALRVGDVGWKVRSAVRASFLGVYSSRGRLALLEEDVRARREMSALLERRAGAGMASSVVLNAARLRLAEMEGELQAATVTSERSLGALAQATGIPLARVRELAFDFAVFEATPPAPDGPETQRAALLNRIDVRTKLLDYAAADAAVKVEIARQNPTILFTPGYLWDQGDNVWTLAAAVLLPSAGNQPAIQVAEARRDLAAAEVKQLQLRVIIDADAGRGRYRSASEAAVRAATTLALSEERAARARKQFDAGYTDRVELVGARLEHLAAERSALALRIESQAALGALEDALQTPLVGGPLPQIAGERAPASAASGGFARR